MVARFDIESEHKKSLQIVLLYHTGLNGHPTMMSPETKTVKKLTFYIRRN